MDGLIDRLNGAAASGLFLVVLGPLLMILGSLFWLCEDRLTGRPVVVDESMRLKLVSWGLLPSSDLSDFVRRLHAYRYPLGGVTALACGLAVGLAGIGQAVALRAGAPPPLPQAGFAGLQPLLYLAMVAGTGAGYPIGVWLVRRRAASGPRYADLRERRLADYRSPTLRWLGLALIAPAVAAAPALVLLGARWDVLVPPAEMVLACAVAELLMWTASRVARLVVMPDPAIARRCDDLVRAEVIAQLQSMLLFAIAFAYLFSFGWSSRGLPVPAVLGALGAGMLAAVAGAFTGSSEGRLGGRITGWVGWPMPAW